MSFEHIRRYLDHCVNEKKYCSASMNQTIACLRTFYNMMDPDNCVMSSFGLPKVSSKIPVLLDKDEIARLIDASSNIIHRTVIGLLYGSGLRLTELVNLKLSDIDFKALLVRIRYGKGKQDRFTILSKLSVQQLKLLFASCRPKEFVFENASGAPRHRDSFPKVLKTAAKSAGITKRVYPHLLRHCFAVHLYEAGVDIAKIQKMLGHKSITTTMVYVRVSTAVLRQVASPADSLGKGLEA
jgi:site-specific recombinase XerD